MVNLFFISNEINKRVAEYVNENNRGRGVALYYRDTEGSDYLDNYFIRDLSIPRIMNRVYDTNPLLLPLLWKQIREMEENVREVIERLTGGSEFSLYLPHFKWIEAIITGSDSRCTKVNILEEGSVAYGDKHDLLKWDMGRRKASIRWFVQSFLLESSLSGVLGKVSTYYCLSRSAFKWTSNKVLVDKASIFPYEEPIRRRFENDIIVLIDSAPVHGWIDPTHYIRRLGLIIDKLAKRTSRIWFKRHPIYDDETKATSDIRAWLDRLDERDEVGECHIPIEDIIGSCNGIKTVSLLSSVGRYAQMCGCRTYSWFGFLDLSCIQEDKIPYFRGFEDCHNSIKEMI